MNTVLWLACALVVIWSLAYFRVGRSAWIVGIGVYLLALEYWSGLGGTASTIAWLVFLVAAAFMLVPGLRRSLISDRLLKWFRRVSPQVSHTEQEA
ncbi:MAG: hypothetical protein GTO41_07100, partial [Burkholderiales bacterium]|nr:hypothetical protein [Burkholderiales bacterium]